MLKFFFTPKYFQVLRQNNSKSFYLENIKVRLGDNFSTDWFHWCVCECTKSGSVGFFFQSIFVGPYTKYRSDLVVNLQYVCMSALYNPPH